MQEGKEVWQRAGPLNGWRAIAGYLGRNQSTVKRWAADGRLPVHRPKGSAARKGVPVYAFSHELDAWLKGRPTDGGAEDLPGVERNPAATPGEEPRSAHDEQNLSADDMGDRAASFNRRIGRRALITTGLAAGTALGLAAWWQHARTGPVTADDLPPDIRQAYLDAHYLWQRRTPDSLRQAEQILLHIREQAPRFSRAQADLATVYNLMVEYGVLPPQDGYDRSRAAAGLAIALDPDLPQAYSVLGDIAVFWDRDYDLGLSYFEKALARDPQDAQTHHWYASALMGLGLFSRAAEQIIRAREFEPLSRSIGVSSAMVQLGLGQYDTARAALLQIVGNEPGYRSPYRFLSFAELARGDNHAYLDALEQRFTLTADRAGLTAVRAGKKALESGGRTEMAFAMLAADDTLPSEAGMEPYFLAHLLALAGDWLAAADQLNATPTRHAFYYGIDPAFASARQDDIFLQALADAGLPVIRALG